MGNYKNTEMLSAAMFRSYLHTQKLTSTFLLSSSTNRTLLMNAQTPFRSFSTANDDDKINMTIFEEARIGDNVHPTQFDKEKVMSNVDPDTMLKKQQNLEYKELPKDGKHDDKEYHVMKSLDPFKN